jgi:hypothetical protein
VRFRVPFPEGALVDVNKILRQEALKGFRVPGPRKIAGPGPDLCHDFGSTEFDPPSVEFFESVVELACFEADEACHEPGAITIDDDQHDDFVAGCESDSELPATRWSPQVAITSRVTWSDPRSRRSSEPR